MQHIRASTGVLLCASTKPMVVGIRPTFGYTTLLLRVYVLTHTHVYLYYTAKIVALARGDARGQERTGETRVTRSAWHSKQYHTFFSLDKMMHIVPLVTAYR